MTYIDIYRYGPTLQSIQNGIVLRDPTNTGIHFIHSFQQTVSTKHPVSQMYKRLMLDTSDNILHIKGQWEMELNTIIDDDTWEDICNVCLKGVCSQMWKEFDWKVKTRFFRTPLKV